MLLAAAVFAACAAPCEPLPVEHFSRRPQIGTMQLSPDGKRLLVLGDYRKSGYGIYMIDLATLKPQQVVQPTNDNWASAVGWIQDDWFWFSIANEYGFNRGWRVMQPGRKFFEGVGCSGLSSVAAPPTRDGNIFVQCRGSMGLDVYRHNLKSEFKEMVARNPDRFSNWIVDHAGEVRVAMRFEEKPEGQRVELHMRAPGAPEWQKVYEYVYGEEGYWPLGFDYDNRTLYLLSNVGRRTWAVYRYDAIERKLGELVYGRDDVDIGNIVMSRHDRKVVGVTFDDGTPQVHWIDASRAQIERDLRDEFPGQALWTNFSDDGAKALVFVYGDTSPGEYHLFDVAKGELLALGKRSPWIEPSQMAPVEPITFKARDGLVIHGYLTRPRAAPGVRLPLIVNPHGGPFGIRDYWGFDPETQFLASRGYAVLQVNFRGSGGYGPEFEKAGWGEWGLKMQDDITDGVLWAVEQGYADRDRVCIYGASYGGYAALMGLIATPELYRCGINYVGVSNLVRLYEQGYAKYGGTNWYAQQRRGWFKRAIGGRWGDAKALVATSPVQQAARIQAPLLVIHGLHDYVVPVIHAYELRSALEDGDKQYEWLLNEHEGHGFRKPENVRDLYLRMEAFLAKHMAPLAGAEATAAR
jgi:dipeptidyl aminopeptidase/acylaminoacyl peptidase